MSEELPAVARLYYSGNGHRRYKRASTRSGPGEPLCFVSVASYALRRRDAEIAMLRLAIQKTLDENGHLADGDNCTLIRLKRALETPNATNSADAEGGRLEWMSWMRRPMANPLPAQSRSAIKVMARQGDMA